MRDSLARAWAVLCLVAGLLIPRFITEKVAIEHNGGEDGGWADWDIVCSLEDVEPGEVFDGIATVDAFTWLGRGVTYRIGDFQPWPGTV